jgi:AcrR family transcriptional regulator
VASSSESIPRGRKAALPANIRRGRNGRIAILKKVPRDLWAHPRYAGKSKVIERSTGTTDVDDGTRIALDMLSELERDFSAARSEIAAIGASSRRRSASASKTATRPDGSGRRRRSTSRVGEATKREILVAAMGEFAEKGLKGARVDDIAAKTRTTKPMIYYHFGSKEKLYAAVIEEAYVRVRDKEQGLHIDDLSPEQGMRRLVEVTFDHHAIHPDYVRLVCVENMERARHMSKRPSLVQRNAIAIETVRKLLERGERAGIFRSGLDPWHVHFLINSYCFMRVSNRYTWRAVFEKDLWDPADAPLQRQMIIDAVLRYVRVDN